MSVVVVVAVELFEETIKSDLVFHYCCHFPSTSKTMGWIVVAVRETMELMAALARADLSSDSVIFKNRL